MDDIHFAPPKNPWNDDSPVDTNKEWLPVVSKGSGSLRRRANGSLRDRANGSLRDRFLQKACRACMRVDMFARDVCLYTRMREHVCACLCLSACISHDICDVYVS